MADLTVTEAQVAAVDPTKAEIHPMIAAETITAGQAVFRDTAGKVQLADANATVGQRAIYQAAGDYLAYANADLNEALAA